LVTVYAIQVALAQEVAGRRPALKQCLDAVHDRPPLNTVTSSAIAVRCNTRL